MTTTSPHGILIVEDERIVAKDLQHTLNAMGYDAFAIAASADDALRHAGERRPALVLMDIRIKGRQDGIETAALIRQRHGVPVVFLTAHADDATLERAKLTTPYGYLMKPVKAAELRSAIEISLHRHDMEHQLRERKRWFSTTLRSIDDAVITVDTAGRTTFVNPAAERLVGIAADLAIGRLAGDLVQLAEASSSPLDEVLAHRRNVAIHEAAFAAPGGARRSITGSASPVIDGDELLGAVMVFRDVTEQLSVRHRLEIADRLASLGTLTSGVAHEINNPLAVVIANASYVRSQMHEISDALSELGAPGCELAAALRELSEVQAEIAAAGARIGKIVTDLKAFSRPVEPTAGVADIGRAIGWAVRATEHEFRHRARLNHDVAALPPARADEARLGQVFVNLLMNAAQAIAPGTANDNEVAIRGRAEGERIIVEVQDTGPGIAPDVLRRIFEPFYTTRDIGQGTGLGLSVCHGIVTSVGGEIQVESEVGRGTTFRVILHAAARPAVVAMAAPAPTRAVRRGRILIIDDDAMVHRTLRRLLRSHDLVCAESGREALALFDRGARFDVILSDLMMPVMTAIELHSQLLARHPEQADRMVFVTGAAMTTPEVERFLRSVPNLTLEKPFGVPEIQSLIARLLGDAAERAEAAPRAPSGESGTADDAITARAR